ncbi:MAG: 6-phosphofructo-2-kinase/fructose-2,6-bisphosphatase [Myxococcota bacterium]|nr:6-phosphofructo-2-kinase/fructose-2,6-bisphosphatase [Myxococcota bacterium]
MKLVLVMVGLPARGKTYTARKISRYLSWKGLKTKVFNVGNYRRDLSGAQVPHQFFNHQNEQGMAARREAAQHALNDLLVWLEQGGVVAIYDATNSTKARRKSVLDQMERVGARVAFVESICYDESIVDANIIETKLGSPDYAGIQERDAVEDFRARIAHYLSVYETIDDEQLSWIKIIDAGRQLILNRINSYLLSRIVNFVMNLHIHPKTIWLSRHGQSVFNVEGRVGGDSVLSPRGNLYSQSLQNFFINKEIGEVWTSTLKRTVMTASTLSPPVRQWKILDEINAGICDGLTYEQIAHRFPDVAAARKADKLRYRYPQGESYEDVIERLEPVIFELEHSNKDILVVAHQAVLRALYAYFANRPRENCPYLSIPLHTVIQLQSKTYGCVEMRFALPPQLD